MSFLSLGVKGTGNCVSRSPLLIQSSLKKEDKGRRDPTLKKSKRKRKKRRQPRRWRPEEINPFKEPLTADSSPPEAYPENAVPRIEEDDNVEGWEETPLFTEMMQKLQEIEMRENNADQLQQESDEGDTVTSVDDEEYAALNRDPGQMLEASDDILDLADEDDVASEDEGEMTETDDIDYGFDDAEAKSFLRMIEEMNPENILEENRDIIKVAEQAILAERLKGLPRISAKYDKDDKYKWKDPYAQLCWDLMKLLFPKRGKRLYRQNRAHMNVSEEVKRRRAAKKAKGYSIWLSMEIKNVLKQTCRRIERVDDSEQRLDMVDQAMRKYAAFMKYQEQKFNLRNVIGMLHAVARLSCLSDDRDALLTKHKSLLQALLRYVDGYIPELDGRCICELVWSYQTLGRDGLKAVFEDTSGSDTQQDALDVESILQSSLERAISEEVVFSSQDCAILLRSLIIMELTEDHSSLVQHLLERTVEQMSHLKAQDVSMLLWCLSQMENEPLPSLVPALVARAMDIVPGFSAQGISVSVYSLAKLKHFDCTQLVAAFTTEALKKLNTFKTQELANLMWGLGKLRHLPSPRFLNQIANVSLQRMPEFTLQEASNLIMAYATFGYKHASLMGAIRARIVFHEGSVTSQDLTNIAWAFAILERLDAQFMRFVLERLMKTEASLPLPGKLQIYQCFVHLSIYDPESDVFQLLPPEDLEDCRLSWLGTRMHPVPNMDMDDIYEFLKREKHPCQNRRSIHGGAFEVMTIEKNGVSYVVECLHAETRFRNQPSTLVGKTTWRENALGRLGHSILRINPVRWSSLDSEEEKRELFKNLR